MKLRTGDDNDYNVDDDKKAITITSFPKVYHFTISPSSPL